MKKLFKNSNFIQGFIFFLFAIFIIVNAVKMRAFGESFMSPGLFPSLFGGVLLILSINLFFKSFKEIKKGNNDNQKSFENINNKKFDKQSFFSIFVVLILSLVYLFGLNKFGFIISTMIYLFVFMFYIGERRFSYLISVAVLTPLISYVIFTIILGINLP
ncbi:MAG: tripartite tricarboxylate transporter TctB family protein [Bacillota bacterium]